jgi:hypothetical protein
VQVLGRGLVPRLTIGTLQLSIRCSSIHFFPSSAQINHMGTICPAQEAAFCFEPRQGVRPELQTSGVCPDLSTLFEGLAFTETLYLISQRRQTSACPSCGLQTSFVAKKSSSAPICEVGKIPRRGLPLGGDASPALPASSASKQSAATR